MQGKFVLGMLSDTIKIPLDIYVQNDEKKCKTLDFNIYSFFSYQITDRIFKNIENQSGLITMNFQIYGGTIEKRRLTEKYESPITCISFQLKEENLKDKDINSYMTYFELLASLSNLTGQELKDIKYSIKINKINLESIEEIEKCFGIYRKSSLDIYDNYQMIICRHMKIN